MVFEIAKIWIEIQKAESELKKMLYPNIKTLKNFFYTRNPQTEGLWFNRKMFYKYFFNGKGSISMVSMIKVYIFCDRAVGEDLSADISSWIMES